MKSNNHDARQDAFKQGVLEVSTIPVLFIDPDSRHSPIEQLKSQNSEIGAATEKAENSLLIKATFLNIKKSDPMAFNGIMINGQEHGIVILPRAGIDTKEEVLAYFNAGLEPEIIENIHKNMPGTDEDWMRYIGNHEASHVNSDRKMIKHGYHLEEEVNADRLARSMNNDDMNLAWKDIRALTYDYDTSHASSPLLNNNDKVTTLYMNAADMNRMFLDGDIKHDFNWKAYSGEANTPQELLREDPDAYFSTADKALNEDKLRVMNAYNADPDSHEMAHDAIQMQARINYHKDFEDAWKRRVLGQDIPERQTIQLIPQERENAYFIEDEMRDRIDGEHFRVTNSEEAAWLDDSKLFDSFDWNKIPGNAQNAKELYDQNALQFFTVKAKLLDDMKDSTLSNYKENPTYENLEKVVQLELSINDSNSDVDIYTRVKNRDHPNTEDIQLLNAEERRSYYEQRFYKQDNPEATQPKESEVENTEPVAVNHSTYQQGVDGTAYTTQVKNLPSGKPNIDFDGQNTTVAGMPIGTFFGQISNPSPEAVSLVNGKAPEIENNLDFIKYDTNSISSMSVNVI